MKDWIEHHVIDHGWRVASFVVFCVIAQAWLLNLALDRLASTAANACR